MCGRVRWGAHTHEYAATARLSGLCAGFPMSLGPPPKKDPDNGSCAAERANRSAPPYFSLPHGAPAEGLPPLPPGGRRGLARARARPCPSSADAHERSGRLRRRGLRVLGRGPAAGSSAHVATAMAPARTQTGQGFAAEDRTRERVEGRAGVPEGSAPSPSLQAFATDSLNRQVAPSYSRPPWRTAIGPEPVRGE